MDFDVLNQMLKHELDAFVFCGRSDETEAVQIEGDPLSVLNMGRHLALQIRECVTKSFGEEAADYLIGFLVWDGETAPTKIPEWLRNLMFKDMITYDDSDEEEEDDTTDEADWDEEASEEEEDTDRTLHYRDDNLSFDLPLHGDDDAR